MADKAEGKDEEKKKGGPMKLILLIVVPVLLIVIGGLVAFLVLRGGGSGSSASATTTATITHTPGTPVALENISINLAGGHYLQLGLALQPEGTETVPDGAQAKDIAIELFSGMTVAELSTAKGRDAAKAELVEKIAKAYDDEVYDVYFTSFVMQ